MNSAAATGGIDETRYLSRSAWKHWDYNEGRTKPMASALETLKGKSRNEGVALDGWPDNARFLEFILWAKLSKTSQGNT